MSVSKIAITLDEEVLRRVDRLVKAKVYPNRSRAIQDAVARRLQHLDRTRLSEESAKLDPRQERLEADAGLAEDLASWPAY